MPKNREAKSFLKRPLQKPESSLIFSSRGLKKKRVKLSSSRIIQKPYRRKRIALPTYKPPVVSNAHTNIGTKTKTNSRFLKVLTKVFFALGFLLLAVYIVLRINQEIQLAYVTPRIHQSPDSVKQVKVGQNPTRIVISKVAIDLEIEQTAINEDVWQISQKGVSYLDVSAKPGEKGAIIMYGHNTNDRFGPIRWLVKGDRIDVKTADGRSHVYTISQTMKVKPDKMDVFNQDGETLILYTCDGFADLERFVIIAKP